MLFLSVLLFTCVIGSSQGGHHRKPTKIPNKGNCLQKCNGKGGLCEEYCGQNGFCCRQHFGECLQSFEDVALSDTHVCIKGSEDVKHKDAIRIESCKVTILPGNHVISQNVVFGMLDVIPEEFSITFEIKPMINTSAETEYRLVFYSKAVLGKGGEFIVTGKNGNYKLLFCGSMSGIEQANTRKAGCYTMKQSIRANQRVHIHMHQVKDDNDLFTQKTYINHVLVRKGKDLIPESLRNVTVVGVVIPKKDMAGVLGNVYFGGCGTTFDRTEKSV